jgi:hypothetical protein
MIDDLLVKDPARRMGADDAEEALRRIAERTVGIFRPPQQRRLKAPPPAGRPVVGRATAIPARPVRSRRFGIRFGPERRAGLRRIGAGIAVAAALAGAGTAAAVASPDGRPTFRPAASIACGAGGALKPTPGTPPYALPSGWVWHSDPAGFDLALPGVWTRSASAGGACFADAPADGTFTVDTRGPATVPTARHWQAAERAALADGSLPGYELVGMDVLALKRGGADWEYSWQPADGPRMHVRRVLLAVDDAHAYLLQWTSPATGWTATVPMQQRIVDSIKPS